MEAPETTALALTREMICCTAIAAMTFSMVTKVKIRFMATKVMTAFMEVKVLIFLMAVRVMTCWMAAIKSVTLIFSVPDMAKIPLVITP